MNRKYITTPLYYPNAKAHIGTAYTTIICDVLARYERLFANDVRFITGLDEHGQKIEESAKKNNVSPQEWVDRMSVDFINLWKALDIQYDDFVRTTEERHEYTVENIIQKVYENGDIYEGEYKGKYCVSEETFVTESQLVDGKYMGKEVIEVSEPSYFFRLSKYADKLLEHYENNPDFILPKQRKNELVSFITQGLQDLSISRTTFSWGIPLKLHNKHIVYVWFDALNGYLTSAGYNTSDFDKWWNNSDVIHFLGKDILRFHGVIWPAMLMSAGVKLPKSIAAHGWWTVDGEKMSKSLGNVVDPIEEIEKYGLDAFRYFLLRESTFGQDADYSNKLMISRINADLANDLGNLINRTIGMQKKYFGDVVIKNTKLEAIDKELYDLYNEVIKEIRIKLDECNFSKVLELIWKLISRLNKYIDETMPWTLYKEQKTERLQVVMYNLFNFIYKIAYLIQPVLTTKAKDILYQIGLEYEYKNIYEINDYPENTTIRDAFVLFPRIEEKKSEYEENLKIANAINIEDFSKVNISVVSIEKVEKVANSDKLLRFIINTGKEKRQVLSAIAKYYTNLEELVGKKVLAVINLEERKIADNVSQAMLLTIDNKKKTTLIFVDENIKDGVKIK